MHFAAATPSEAAPIDTDELGIASVFQGSALELVPSTQSDVEMIAQAMYALECEMVPGEVDDEGPFAEVTGYYAKRAPRPVVHVKAIHHRKAPVFQTILSGVEVWNSVGLLGEANVMALLQRQVPGVRDVFFSHGGCGFYHCIVALRPVRAGWSKQAIMATFAAFPPLKMVTVVDDDVDIRNPMDVEWAMTTRLDPLTGVITDPRMLRPRPQPELSGLQGHQDRLRLHAAVPLHPGLRPRRLQAGLARRLRARRRLGGVGMDGRRRDWLAGLRRQDLPSQAMPDGLQRRRRGSRIAPARRLRRVDVLDPRRRRCPRARRCAAHDQRTGASA